MQTHAFAWPTTDPDRGRYRSRGAGGRSDAPGSAWATNGKALFQGPYHTSATLTTWVKPPPGLLKKVWKLWNKCSIIFLSLSKTGPPSAARRKAPRGPGNNIRADRRDQLWEVGCGDLRSPSADFP